MSDDERQMAAVDIGPSQVLGRARVSGEMPTTTLVAKLAAIMAEVKALPKEGWNPGQQFKYVTVGQMIETVRPLMAAAGVLLYPDTILERTFEEGTTRQGAAMTECYLTVHWTVTDGQGTLALTTVGEAHDSGDKAANKAFTAAHKQALSKLFMFSADEDPDSAAAMDREPRQTAHSPRGDDAVDPTSPHYCAEHRVMRFKKGKMRSYAHPIRGSVGPDGKELWCHEPSDKPSTSRDASPALMTEAQFIAACKERGLTREGVFALLGETVKVLHTAGRSYNALLAEIDQVRGEGQTPEEPPNDPFDNGEPTA